MFASFICATLELYFQRKWLKINKKKLKWAKLFHLNLKCEKSSYCGENNDLYQIQHNEKTQKMRNNLIDMNLF